MIDEKYLLNKSATNKFIDVKKTTEILAQYGISHNEKKTRDLIAKGRLKARGKGDNPNDRRSGYEISEKNIYDLVVQEIPIMKQFLDLAHSATKSTTKAPAKGTSKPTVRKTTKKSTKATEDVKTN